MTTVIPTFTSAEAARAWQAANSRGRLFPLATSWRDVERLVLGAMRAHGPSKPAAGVSDVCLRSAPVHAHAADNPDAVLNTLRYLFHHTRCGIYACVRNGELRAFVPFANATYTNTWSSRVVLEGAGYGNDVDAYARAKGAGLHRPVEDMLPLQHWWLNGGGIVCNVAPEDVWGESMMHELYDMLHETAGRTSLPDCDLFINKRDYPQLRRQLHAEPYQRFTGVAELVRERYSAYAPVLSFYTGDDFADVAMPTADDWAVATGRVFLPAAKVPPVFPAEPSPLSRRAAKAVFRGSATGWGTTPETNVRLRLAAFSKEHPDVLDAAIVGVPKRDKIKTVADGRVHITWPAVPPQALPRATFMPLTEQASTFRYIVYADGHCAASRYGTLMHSGCVILRVASEQTADCGRLWLDEQCTAATVDDVTSFSNADHVLIRPDLGDLAAAVAFLNGHLDVAEAIVRRARDRAPTVDTIVQRWHRIARMVHATQCHTTGDGAEWFGACDARYSRQEHSTAGQWKTARADV